MKKMRKKGKRLLALFLSLLTAMSALPMVALAFTPQEGQTVYSFDGVEYQGSDGRTYALGPRHYILYDGTGNVRAEYSEGGDPYKKHMIRSADGGERHVYCIESGIPYAPDGTGYVSQNGANSNYFQQLPYPAQYGIMLTSVYGWQPGKAVPVAGCNEDDYMIATQTLLWEYQQQIRTSPSDLHDNAYGVEAGAILQMIDGRPARRCYDWMLAQMAKHTTIPSFAASRSSQAAVHTLKYDTAAKKYTLTLEDTNHTLNDLRFVNGNGITVTRNGDRYTFTSDRMLPDAVTVTAKKDIPEVRDDMLIWGAGGWQTMLCGSEDPVVFYIKLRTETTGIGRIVKHSEDGVVEQVRFTVSGNGIQETVATKADGTVDLELHPGVYDVAELSEEKYEPQEVQRVTIVSGGTSTVTFDNTLKRGSLTVTKTCEDGLSEGIRFRLSGTSLSGLTVEEYAVTDSRGIAEFKNVLIGSGYVLEEVEPAVRYVVPEKQTAAIEWNQVTKKSFHNVLKKWQLTVKKSDGETGTAQGDGSLAGAVYGIYQNGKQIDTYTTDQDGTFTTKVYPCGEGWSLKEEVASEGYLVTSGSTPIGAEAEHYNAEYNRLSLEVTEQVLKGRIALIKHCDDGETQIETPEAGAEFEVYLKKSGSYGDAKEAERDFLTCDENGFAQTKDLPYGIYTVKQTKGWDGRELMDAFDVFVNQDGEIFRFLINNAPFRSRIQVVKTDAETGKPIPYAGAGFQIFRPDGSLVEMTYTYPEVTRIDTFYTTEEGMLITPEPLEYGTGYTLVEVSAPYGYVLNSDPVPFDVTEEGSSEEGEVTVIRVERPNLPQKGIITVKKSGEVFASVTVIGGGAVDEDGAETVSPTVYQPVYAEQGLAGAVYEVSAAEDIVTPDGTLRYEKGKVVARLTTDESGTAMTEPLYLGTYEVREMEAPDGFVLNGEPCSVELSYAGEAVAVTGAEAGFHNERQKAEISLEKVLAEDERFQIGLQDEILSVQFGLFVAEELKAADGSVIPADGLLELVNCSEDGSASFRTDLPVGASLYVKELQTDDHYILSGETYPVVFDYAGQETALVELRVQDGSVIENDLIYGQIRGLKTDRETGETIEGALFGLFGPEEGEFTEESAILTARSDGEGVFLFSDVPFGSWVIRELAPAEGFLPCTDLHHVQVEREGQLVELSAVNDRVPEIGTRAEVDGKKEICATEVFTLTDTVSYAHLIPGKEYTVTGVLMDKASGKPLVLSGSEIRSEVLFVPEEPSGEVLVEFSFDSRNLREDVVLVAFESLSLEGKELAVHADLSDEDQTVRVKAPKIGTVATVDGKKEITAEGTVTVEDTVTYENLTPGKEYTVKGVLMDKGTGTKLVVDGEGVAAEATFTPDKESGEAAVSFSFDVGNLTKDLEIVAFETLYRDGKEIAAHADLSDESQTVAVRVPKRPETPEKPRTPDVPLTGDQEAPGFWLGLTAIALGGLAAILILYLRMEKDEEGE